MELTPYGRCARESTVVNFSVRLAAKWGARRNWLWGRIAQTSLFWAIVMAYMTKTYELALHRFKAEMLEELFGKGRSSDADVRALAEDIRQQAYAVKTAPPPEPPPSQEEIDALWRQLEKEFDSAEPRNHKAHPASEDVQDRVRNLDWSG